MAAAGAGSPTVYNSGHYSELVSTVTITKPPAPNPWMPIMCVDLGTIPAANEILYVSAEVEVTNPQAYNIDVEARLMLTTSCTDNDGGEISDSTGYNLTPAMHHGTITKVGSWVTESGSTRNHVTLALAVESNASRPGDKLTIEQDHGRIIVLRWA